MLLVNIVSGVKGHFALDIQHPVHRAAHKLIISLRNAPCLPSRPSGVHSSNTQTQFCYYVNGVAWLDLPVDGISVELWQELFVLRRVGVEIMQDLFRRCLPLRTERDGGNKEYAGKRYADDSLTTWQKEDEREWLINRSNRNNRLDAPRPVPPLLCTTCAPQLHVH